MAETGNDTQEESTAYGGISPALPALPEPHLLSSETEDGLHHYTASQMRAYGEACRASWVPADVGQMEYRGNSVGFIHEKMRAYRKGIDDAWAALREAGHGPDGTTPLCDMIRRALAAPPAASGVPAEPVAYLKPITHPDWLDTAYPDEPGAFPVYAHPAPASGVPAGWPDVDELAQQIRWVNGNNKMGAAVLAERLLDWLRSRAAPPSPPAPSAVEARAKVAASGKPSLAELSERLGGWPENVPEVSGKVTERPRSRVVPGVVYVCPEKDIECGWRPENWCQTCPKRAAGEEA